MDEFDLGEGFAVEFEMTPISSHLKFISMAQKITRIEGVDFKSIKKSFKSK